jgi:hypothetical protein
MHVDGFCAVLIAISAASDGLHVWGSGSDGSARRQSQARTRLGGLQTRRTAALGWWCGARAPSGSGTGSPQGSGLVSCRRAVCGARVGQRVSRQNVWNFSCYISDQYNCFFQMLSLLKRTLISKEPLTGLYFDTVAKPGDVPVSLDELLSSQQICSRRKKATTQRSLMLSR